MAQMIRRGECICDPVQHRISNALCLDTKDIPNCVKIYMVSCSFHVVHMLCAAECIIILRKNKSQMNIILSST